jgi:methanogenic corrinoid protein MtbC1
MKVDAFEDLGIALMEYDSCRVAELTRKLLDEGSDPVKILDALTVWILAIGEQFEQVEAWLPDLVGGAEVLQKALPIVEERLARIGWSLAKSGKVVIGTVFGDIHSIGKGLVASLLLAAGFEVKDLGINVRAEEFVEAVERESPHILAMSALMTTTIAEQKRVMKLLQERGLRPRVQVMIGGAAVTSTFAREIGADGYDPTAPGAVALAKRLIAAGMKGRPHSERF